MVLEVFSMWSICFWERMNPVEIYYSLEVANRFRNCSVCFLGISVEDMTGFKFGKLIGSDIIYYYR